MAVVEFLAQSKATETARPVNTARLLNLYREPVSEGGLSRHILRAVPGQVLFVDIGDVFLRQMAWVDNVVYAAASGVLYAIADDGTATDMGTIKDSAETTISGNDGYVTICAGGKYYVLDGGTLTEPTAGAFSDFGSVDTLENFTLLTERNGRRIQWSNAADPTTLDGLSFATTESGPDKNIRGISLNGNYWVFKERSTEIWYATGLSDQAFKRVGGGVLEVGLKAFNLVAKGRDMIFFVGSDGIAYMTTGAGMQPVSTRGVEADLASKDATHCGYYETEGHKFCVIRFSDRPAWVYDLATGEWHERSEGVNHGPWDAVAAVKNNAGKWLAGGSFGKVYSLDDVQTDKGGILYRRAISSTLRMESKRFNIPEMELFGAFGYANVTPEVGHYLGLSGGYMALGGGFVGWGTSGDKEPTVMISLSGDQGATWGVIKAKPLGALGDYEQRVLLRRLGRFRTATVRMDISHGYDIPMYSDGLLRVS